MNWNDFEQHFSAARVGRYQAHFHGNAARAMGAYAHNLLLAEATLPLLNVLEIALRNRLQDLMTQFYSRLDWWEALRGNPQFNWQVSEVDKAKAKLLKRCEAQTVDKIVAELTFGFWSSLFNTQFQHTLWKPLRLAFANCPRQYRQRHTISAALNEARDLRNRVVHHESLLWLTPSLLDMHTKCTTILGWIDPKLVKWVAVHDRLPGAWAAWQAY